MRPHQALALGLASLPLPACGGGVSPRNGALRGGTCAPVQSRAAPLLVDWAAPDRRALQVRMATGIVVVAYDCHGIRLLPECHVDGHYGYVGAGHDPLVVQLQSAEEVRANLPSTGAVLQGPAISELDHGRAIDLGFVTAGRKRTTRGYASAQDLVGDCDGATHFVRGAMIGAFAVDAGARGKARNIADVFDGGARGGAILSATERRVQGAIAACAASRAGDEVPPEGCDAVYRVELAAIETTGPLGGPSRPLGDLAPECGGGMVWSEGKCMVAGSETLQVCNTASRADCEAQCNRDEQQSCFALGWMYENGRGVTKDLGRARSLYEGVCRRRTAVGCRGLGWLYSEGIGVPRDPGLAIPLYQQACDDGDADACSNLGHMYGTGEGIPQDFATAYRLSRKGCDGGDPNGCNSMGILHEKGWGVSQNPALAAIHYRQACDGGNAMGCANLGNLLVLGHGVTADRAQGLELLRRGCAGGNAWGCQKLQQLGHAP